MPKVLVIGVTGQVGSEIKELSTSYSEYEFVFADRKLIDLENMEKNEDFFNHNAFDIIVNCAAYTAVDKAENEPLIADRINHQFVDFLAQTVKLQKAAFVHISTDYVFDGKNYQPYVENDCTDPQGVYGRTKRDGESAILKAAPANTIIIRTSWVYSSKGNNFVKTMLRLGKDKDSLGVIFDQIGTPTYARDLAKAILDILPKIKNHKPEVYHFSNEGVASWYDFAKSIFEFSQINCHLHPITTDQYPTPAKRPHYSLLDKKKFKQDFDIVIPYWRESLYECLKLLGECK